MFAVSALGHQRPFKPKLTMRYLLEYCSLTIMELRNYLNNPILSLILYRKMYSVTSIKKPFYKSCIKLSVHVSFLCHWNL